QQALEWAFATECAQLDFDDLAFCDLQAGDFDQPGRDTITTIQRRGELGCTVDGGGYNEPHPDAQIIAAAVAALPINVGGRKMASIVAECARARGVPDWRADERRGVVPCGWEMTDRGEWMAATRKLPVAEYYYPRGRKTLTYTPEICRISYTGSAEVLAQRRRAYLAWYGALLHLLSDLSRCYGFEALRLTDGLPALSPWNPS
ncbi:hypothetical protein, partial [Paracoccus sp. (in: a-proteobacteria)]|uniref:hypothetical protein n=1 Tax=Paracoccus sp. TaxID=267 RepID=UPI00289AEA91